MKFKKLFLAILFTTAFVAGCDDQTHEHTFSNTYTYDETNHWKVSTCEHELYSELKEHDFGDDNTCDTCGYTKVIPHEHTFSNTYTYDETNHWKESTCEHELYSELNEHDFGDDNTCDTCGYTKVIPHEHTFSDHYSYDIEKHWLSATCEHEEITSSLASHTYVNGVCSICGAPQVISTMQGQMIDIITNMLPESAKSTMIGAMAIMIAQGYQLDCVGENANYIRYPFYYHSTLLDGEPVLLSGAITIPYNGNEIVAHTVVVSSHPTFTDLSEAPSNGFDLYSLPALTGSIVLEFDLLGYGISKDKPVDYHCRHLSSRNTVDGIITAGELIQNCFDINIFELPMFNIGYSQGGYDSLALLRYMEEEATTEEKELIHITQTLSGSGAYSPMIMLQESFKDEDYNYSEYLLLAIMSGFNFHSDDMGSLTYNDILTDKGLQLLEILTHKNDAELQAFKLENTTGPKDVFKEECFVEENDLIKALNVIAEKENLLDGSWTPTGEIKIYYSTEDEMVTCECSLAAEQLWGQLENFEALEIGSLIGKDHRSAAVDYYIQVVSLIADTIVDMMD